MIGSEHVLRLLHFLYVVQMLSCDDIDIEKDLGGIYVYSSPVVEFDAAINM